MKTNKSFWLDQRDIVKICLQDLNSSSQYIKSASSRFIDFKESNQNYINCNYNEDIRTCPKNIADILEHHIFLIIKNQQDLLENCVEYIKLLFENDLITLQTYDYLKSRIDHENK